MRKDINIKAKIVRYTGTDRVDYEVLSMSGAPTTVVDNQTVRVGTRISEGNAEVLAARTGINMTFVDKNA